MGVHTSNPSTPEAEEAALEAEVIFGYTAGLRPASLKQEFEGDGGLRMRTEDRPSGSEGGLDRRRR